MTRKDYQLIAATIASQRTDSRHNLLLDRLSYEFAERLEAEGGMDINGNRRFKTDRFLAAAGVRVCLEAA